MELDFKKKGGEMSEKYYNVGRMFAEPLDVKTYKRGDFYCVSITWGDNFYETDPYGKKEYALSEAKGYLEGLEIQLESAINDISSRQNRSYDGWCLFMEDEVYECKNNGMLIDRFDIERCIQEPERYFRLATEEEIEYMISEKVTENCYEEIGLRDGDDEGVTLQFSVCGRNVSDFRISKSQAIALIEHLADYLKENV